MVRASLCGVLYLLYRTPGGKSTSKSALLYTRRGWAQFRRAVQRRQGFRQALAGRKEGEDRTFCKKPAFGSSPKGGSKGGRRSPSRKKEPVYKMASKDKTKQRLFCALCARRRSCIGRTALQTLRLFWVREKNTPGEEQGKQSCIQDCTPGRKRGKRSVKLIY